MSLKLKSGKRLGFTSATPPPQADHLYGISGTDTLKGGKGKDWLEGGADSDQLYGNEDNDTR